MKKGSNQKELVAVHYSTRACPKCGGRRFKKKEGLSFFSLQRRLICQECGKTLRESELVWVKVSCSKCGTEQVLADRRCGNCGAPLSAPGKKPKDRVDTPIEGVFFTRPVTHYCDDWSDVRETYWWMFRFYTDGVVIGMRYSSRPRSSRVGLEALGIVEEEWKTISSWFHRDNRRMRKERYTLVDGTLRFTIHRREEGSVRFTGRYLGDRLSLDGYGFRPFKTLMLDNETWYRLKT